jgi:integrase/recombinase XerD
MDAKFEQFLRERQYLKNVSRRTLGWYQESFRWLGSPDPTHCDLKSLVIRMRQAGLKPTSCNNRIRAVNAYLRWSGSPLHLDALKEPQRVLPTFSKEDIIKVARWKPRGFCRFRLQVLVLMLADTGCRISELLTLRWDSVDFDNLLVTVVGKGDKQRRIPFSFELRRFLYRFKQQSKHDLVLCTRRGQSLTVRNVHRAVHGLFEDLGVKTPVRMLHAMRHTFAINYLRAGGNVLFLQRVLGHATLEMTRRYCNVLTEDLQKVHQKLTMLSGV